MNIAWTRTPAPRRRALATALAAAAALAGCGGGYDDGYEEPQYVVWSNSVNGTVIRDDNNEGFAVRVDNRALVHLAANTQLNGLTVDASSNVLDRGTRIGAVVIGPSTTGASIAVLRCVSGRSMDVRLNGGAWDYVCL